MQKKTRSRAWRVPGSGSWIPGQARADIDGAYVLLLLPVDFFSPPWLLRLLVALPLAALALPLLSDDEALLLRPPDLLGDDADFELPDFMGISFGLMDGRSAVDGLTLGAHLNTAVGVNSALLQETVDPPIPEEPGS